MDFADDYAQLVPLAIHRQTLKFLDSELSTRRRNAPSVFSALRQHMTVREIFDPIGEISGSRYLLRVMTQPQRVEGDEMYFVVFDYVYLLEGSFYPPQTVDGVNENDIVDQSLAFQAIAHGGYAATVCLSDSKDNENNFSNFFVQPIVKNHLFVNGLGMNQQRSVDIIAWAMASLYAQSLICSESSATLDDIKSYYQRTPYEYALLMS